MRQVIRVWAIITFMVLVWVMQFNQVTDYKSSKYLKEEMELGLHDAGLFIKLDRLAEGYVVFDKDLSYNAFVNSIRMNTNLADLQPTGSSFFEDEFKVLRFEVFDDSNTVFPYTYQDPTYSFQDTFLGPSIFVIIETYGPRYFNGEKRLIRRASSYTYKQ
jgi:hypothetical protein